MAEGGERAAAIAEGQLQRGAELEGSVRLAWQLIYELDPAELQRKVARNFHAWQQREEEAQQQQYEQQLQQYEQQQAAAAATGLVGAAAAPAPPQPRQRNVGVLVWLPELHATFMAAVEKAGGIEVATAAPVLKVSF